jgi:hypothetical protein
LGDLKKTLGIGVAVGARDRNDSVVFEGALGELRGIRVDDEVMLEIIGTNGVLRIDLTRDEIARSLARKTPENA